MITIRELTSIARNEQARLERSNHGGGVAIYIKDNIRFNQRNDIPTNGLETVRIEVEPLNVKSFSLGKGLRMIRLRLSTKWKK